MIDSTGFEPTRAAALGRMSEFLDRAGRDYAKTRNFDFGPQNRGNVSTLSPYVRHRLLTECELLTEVVERHSAEVAGKFIDEVFWRAYFKGWLECRPTVWSDYRYQVARLLGQLEADAELRERYESAVSASTGIDCFDAWATELIEIGYLHNHARMWFASIWVFTLGLPWQLGADLFYRHLTDADPASNTLSWRWVCGLHTSGKTYLARVSNISGYTAGRFNPSKQLAVSAPPLSESTTHAVQPLPAPQAAQTDESFGLLVSEEDCSPESLGLAGKPQRVIGTLATDARSPLAVSRLASAFAIGAVTDAVERAKRHYGAPGELSQSNDWGAMLAEWAERDRLKTIVTAYAPVGPVAEQLANAQRTLDDNGIRLLQVRRNYDTLTWPHASKGYFKLKARIPEILQHLTIGDNTEAAQAEAS